MRAEKGVFSGVFEPIKLARRLAPEIRFGEKRARSSFHCAAGASGAH